MIANLARLSLLRSTFALGLASLSFIGCAPDGLQGPEGSSPPVDPGPTPAPDVASPPRPQPLSCTIDPAYDPEDPLLDLRVRAVQTCEGCAPVTLRVAEVFWVGTDPRAVSRWLGSLQVGVEETELLLCDTLSTGVNYPALFFWVDSNGDGRCQPTDSGWIDQRYGWGYDEDILAELGWDPPSMPEGACDRLPPL